jgi:hypothetical protein
MMVWAAAVYKRSGLIVGVDGGCGAKQPTSIKTDSNINILKLPNIWLSFIKMPLIRNNHPELEIVD